MSAETLRKAAALMRERAERVAFTAPWRAIPARDGLPAGVVGGQRVIADLDERTDAVEHIASWHPVVALAVADLLDVASKHGRDDYDPDEYDALLAVARTYLGESA